MYKLKLVLACLLLCSLSMPISARRPNKNDVVILFDNDVHGHMTGYPKMAALRQEMLSITPNVCLVSMGDFSQGGPLCSVSHGTYAVEVMNRVGYEFVTLGNHEFDYGLEQMYKLTNSLKAKTLLANFKEVGKENSIFAPYAIREIGNFKVAFIGCTTPITKTSDSPQSFVDAQGNDIYSFCHGTFYNEMQQHVDKVRSLGADIVIVLAHLGDLANSTETSEELIRSTHGIDVVLDGHAHHVIPYRFVKNNQDVPILLSSTGAHFQHLGRLTISPDGFCETELIPVEDYHFEDKEINHLLASYQSAFDSLPTLAQSPYDLAGFDKAHNTYDRNCQTNLGSLTADAFRIMSNADIGWINAGGIRSSIPAGNITFKDLLTAFPFENHIVVAQFTGQQIIDALEYGVSIAPEDNGSYPQVSGLTFKIDLSVKANILNEPTEPFAGIGEGPRRVSDVRVLNIRNNKYEPIDPKRNYSIASIDFILTKHGCNGMLDKGTIIADDQMVDTQVLEEFLNRYMGGVVTSSYKEFKKQ